MPQPLITRSIFDDEFLASLSIEERNATLDEFYGDMETYFEDLDTTWREMTWEQEMAA